jgi:hypothetical protein
MYLECPPMLRIGVAKGAAGGDLPDTICAAANQTFAANPVRRVNRSYCK